MSNYKINADDISWTQVDDEIVIIDLETTHYYSLNNTGAYIWQLLDSQIRSEKELIEKTASYFEQAPETISRDVRAILKHLKAENLILER